MIAWQSDSKRRMSSVMLSSTRKIARAPRRRASEMSASTRSMLYSVKIPAAHLDDRAEAAVVGAAPRGLDDVDWTAEHRVAVEHAGGAIRQPRRARRDLRDGSIGVEHEAAARAIRQAGDVRRTARSASTARSSSLSVCSPSPRTMNSTSSQALVRIAARGWGRIRRRRSASQDAGRESAARSRMRSRAETS